MSKVENLVKEKFGMSMEQFAVHLENLKKEQGEKIAQSIGLETQQLELANRILKYKDEKKFTWEQTALNLGVSEVMLRKVVARDRNLSYRSANFVARQLWKKGV